MRRVEQDHHLSPSEVIEELVHRFSHPGDWPADHRCARSLGYAGSLGYDERHLADGSLVVHKTTCDHGRSEPLIRRVQDLIEPGQRGPQENKGKTVKSPKGSPAPWSAAPAELLDEIRRGAVDLHNTARAFLGLVADPGYAGLPLERRAEYALERLAADVEMIRGRGRADSWLVTSECPGRPECTVGSAHEHPGAIERALRSWHRRALLLTGHEVKRAKVGQVQNPLHPKNSERFYRGPICPRPPHGACDVHQSCEEMRLARIYRFMQARCPWCDSVSLEQDQDTGHVECVRPSCRDDQGHKHMWTVNELARLGLVIVTEQAP